MATGQPCSSPKAITSSGPWRNSSVPGTPATPAAAAARRELTLSPITSMASGGGPMNTTPRSVMARAKSVFSLKKPYPGCTASAPLLVMASRMAGVLR